MWRDHRGRDHKFCREEILGIRVTDPVPFKNNSIAKRVSRQVDEAMAADPTKTQPPEDLLRFTMAKLALEKTKKAGKSRGKSWIETHKEALKRRGGKGKTPFMTPLYSEALAMLWRKSETWPQLRKDYDSRDEATKEAILFIGKCIKTKAESPCERFDRDEVACADTSILEKIDKDLIYLATDMDNTGFLIRWPGAVRYLFGEGVMEKAERDIRIYHSIEPCPKPESCRHTTEPHFGELNPWYSRENTSDYPGAVRGVSHYGGSGASGNPNKPVDAKGASKCPVTEIARLRQEMIEGSLDVISEAHRFVLGIVDPDLLTKQQAAIRKFPVLAKLMPPKPSKCHCSPTSCQIRCAQRYHGFQIWVRTADSLGTVCW